MGQKIVTIHLKFILTFAFTLLCSCNNLNIPISSNRGTSSITDKSALNKGVISNGHGYSYSYSINNQGNGILMVNDVSKKFRTFRIIKVNNFIPIDNALFTGGQISLFKLELNDDGNGILVWCDFNNNDIFINKIDNYVISSIKTKIYEKNSEDNYIPFIQIDKNGSGFVLLVKFQDFINNENITNKLVNIPIELYKPLLDNKKEIKSSYLFQKITKENNNYSFQDIPIKFKGFIPYKTYFYSNENKTRVLSWSNFEDNIISTLGYSNILNDKEEKEFIISKNHSKVSKSLLYKNGTGGIIDIDQYYNLIQIIGNLEGDVYFTSIKDYKENKKYILNSKNNNSICFSPNIDIDENGNGFAIWGQHYGSMIKSDIVIRKIHNYIPE